MIDLNSKKAKIIADNIKTLLSSRQEINIVHLDKMIEAGILPPTPSVHQILETLFLVNRPETIRTTEDGGKVRENRHRRSLEDMYIMCKTYNKNVTFIDVVHYSQFLSSSFCYDVSLRVYRSSSYYKSHQKQLHNKVTGILSSIVLTSDEKLPDRLPEKDLEDRMFRDYNDFISSVRVVYENLNKIIQ